MKQDLNTIKEVLMGMSTHANATENCCKDCDEVLKAQKQALQSLANIQERLESEELVEEVAKVMFVPPISDSRKEDVRAAIAAIRGE